MKILCSMNSGAHRNHNILSLLWHNFTAATSDFSFLFICLPSILASITEKMLQKNAEVENRWVTSSPWETLGLLLLNVFLSCQFCSIWPNVSRENTVDAVVKPFVFIVASFDCLTTICLPVQVLWRGLTSPWKQSYHQLHLSALVFLWM